MQILVLLARLLRVGHSWRDELLNAVSSRGHPQEAGRSEEERRIGICVMDDILEHSPAGGAQIAVQALPILLNSSQAKARRLKAPLWAVRCSLPMPKQLSVLAAALSSADRWHIMAAPVSTLGCEKMVTCGCA